MTQKVSRQPQTLHLRFSNHFLCGIGPVTMLVHCLLLILPKLSQGEGRPNTGFMNHRVFKVQKNIWLDNFALRSIAQPDYGFAHASAFCARHCGQTEDCDAFYISDDRTECGLGKLDLWKLVQKDLTVTTPDDGSFVAVYSTHGNKFALVCFFLRLGLRKIQP